MTAATSADGGPVFGRVDRAEWAAQEPLRAEVRAFLQGEIAAGSFRPACNAWLEGFDREFSARLGARGWIGMTWPERYGGRGRTNIERFVVAEELLAHGAPVAAHWSADRQVGPGLLRHGTEEQRRRFLPGIAAGRCCFAIGMSEPDVGSDLASVRTRARPADGGWRVSGTKIWVSHASRAAYVLALVRTAAPAGDRHAGLSQLIVDMSSPGVSANPIRLLSGHAHFDEVVFDDVFVPDGMVVGQVGQGWRQVMSELAWERSGPERFLSTFPLLAAAVAADHADSTAGGYAVARLWALRTMSRAVASALQAGAVPEVEATIVKDLGTTFEQSLIDYARTVLPGGPGAGDVLGQAVLASPAFTLRGGTTEILRNIVAARLGVR